MVRIWSTRRFGRRAARESTRMPSDMAGPASSTTDPTAAFFEELASRGHEPLLQKAKGSARFDIVDRRTTLRWHVSLEKGDIKVSRRNVAADCVIRADKALFDQVASGKENAVAAVLRGDLRVEGDWRMLVRIQRLFPSSASARRSAARRKRA
jgi:predicted lipid carrier protein YhbT